jgi:hypothetical membrane protein
MHKTLIIRLSAVCGIFAPLVAFGCIGVAILSNQTFSWENNALSDLGVVYGFNGLIFNFGLFASGFLTLIFARFGLFNHFKSSVGKAGSILFGCVAIALIAIGIFNENYSPTHYIFSVAFFVLAPISLLTITVATLMAHQKKLAAVTGAIVVIAALTWILQLTLNYVPNVAVPEAISGLAISIWTVVFGCVMLEEKAS